MGYSIGIMAVYFGKLPASFKVWLKSCENNPSIDWFFITDYNYDEVIPSNVKIIKMEFEEIKEKIKNKLDLNVKIPNPYKLCDYKPTYGLIFEELLKSYDYWGYCDIDLIFGDIRKFITNDILEQYEKILVKGHLTLYKNNAFNKQAFMLKGAKADYKKVFQNNTHFGFDEKNGVEMIYDNNRILQFKEELMLDISTKQLELKSINKNRRGQSFLWKDGKIYRVFLDCGKVMFEEYMYIHYQKRKVLINCEVKNNIDSVFITHKGFIAANEEITEELLSNLQPNSYEKLKFELNKVKLLPKRIINRVKLFKVYNI